MSERDDVLWDPASGDDAELRRLQSLLTPYRATERGLGEWKPSQVPVHARSRRWQPVIAAAVAAVACLYAAHSYRLSWPEGAPWTVNGASGTGTLALQAVPGHWIETNTRDSLDIDVARIGRIVLSPESKLQLVETRGGKHRVRLESGHLRARIWAPPGSFVVDSGNAEVVDVGCDFDVWKRLDGSGRVFVRSGWVEYRVAARDVLLPSGYELRYDAQRPYAPLRPNAAPEFVVAANALARLGAGDIASVQVQALAERASASATDADAYTLLYLLSDSPRLAATPLYPRLARALRVPADEPMHRTAWIAGDKKAVERWWDHYPSQPKHWWSNWRDALH